MLLLLMWWQAVRVLGDRRGRCRNHWLLWCVSIVLLLQWLCGLLVVRWGNSVVATVLSSLWSRDLRDRRCICAVVLLLLLLLLLLWLNRLHWLRRLLRLDRRSIAAV